MDLVTIIIVTAIIIGITWYLLRSSNGSKNLPPGPKGWPIFGNLLDFDPKIKMHTLFAKWAKQYGAIYKIHMASEMAIVINEPKLIREAFNLPALSGRPSNKVFKALAQGAYGVIGVDGHDWTEQRRFTLRHLRNFGFGKNKMETLIIEEAKELIEGFRKENGQAFDPRHRFYLAVLNSLWILISGSRFSQDDQHVTKIITDYFRELDEVFVKSIMSFFPSFATLFPEWSGYNKLVRTIDNTWKFFQGIVTEHESTITDEEPRDYIDAYLQEIKRCKDDPNSSFAGDEGHKHLLAVIGDLFAAGAETTSTTLAWSVLYLAVFPEKQIKMQKEIDSVIGTSKLPSLADRPNMPYTEAVMYEILRFSSIVALGLFHMATEDVEFHGYTIPKGTYVAGNLHLSHHSPDYWEEPEVFRPERFLVTGEDGEVKVQRSENLMPFSVGKRVCLGESLARDEFFLFLTSIFQRFDVQLDPNSEKPVLEPQKTFIGQPHPYKVIMKDRQ